MLKVFAIVPTRNRDDSQMTWTTIIQLLSALGIGGLIGGVITHWVDWSIEKKRMRVVHQRELVKSWRTDLLRQISDDEPPLILGSESPKYDFLRLPEYASIRGHLTPEFLRMIEDARVIVVSREGTPWPRTEFIAEISRIEREWKLV